MMVPPATGCRVLCFGVVFVLLAMATPRPVEADRQGAEAAWQQRTEALISDLEALALQANRRKLFRARNDTYELLLHFAPDHAKARKRLRYKRDAAGTWSQPAGYRPPRNMGAGKLKAWERRRQTLRDKFAKDGLAFLRKHGAVLRPVDRARILADLVMVAPEHREVREARGERPAADGVWLLPESEPSRSRRKHLQATAREALDQVDEPAATRPTKAELALGMSWKDALQGARVRLLSTSSSKEARKVLMHADACFPLLEAVLGRRPQCEDPLTIYLLADMTEVRALVASPPGATDAYKAAQRGRAVGWLPRGFQSFVGVTDAEARLEWCVRQAFLMLLYDEFGVHSSPAWICEGAGIYLSRLLTGRTQSSYVAHTKYAEELRAKDGPLWGRLTRKDADWPEEARVLLSGSRAPDFNLMLGKPLNALTPADILSSWATAAYCIEARPEDAWRLFAALGKERRPIADALAEMLELDAGLLRDRVARWLAETR